MKHILTCMTLAISLMLTAGVAAAQKPQETAWLAAYWNNKSLSGPPVLERQEANVDYNWGNDAPAPEVNEDDFSARWVRTIEVEAGVYRFTATSDDGMRVWVDGERIIDEWYDHPLQTVSVERELSGGQHRIRVEYYEDGGGAVAQLAWVPVGDTGQPWRGEYYNNRNLDGQPALVRSDPEINFNWGFDSPAEDVLGFNDFSARWTNDLALSEGLYRFRMTVDDGGRLWVNNRQMFDDWEVQSPTTHEEEIYIPGGIVPVRMEYFEAEEGAIAQLTWEQVNETNRSWRGEYFDNADLAGEPVFVRNDPEINFNWGQSSPSPSRIAPDTFSVRWRRTFDLPANAYRFTMTVDDGGRLWVNGDLVIDAWQVQNRQILEAEVNVPGGPTSVRMEYFENTGQASALLNWEPISDVSADWRGSYYGNLNFSGEPVMVRRDEHIDFDWGFSSPDPAAIPPNDFSVRWQKTVDLPAGYYCFILTADDGGAFFVNNEPLMNEGWQGPEGTTYARKVEISGGPTSLEVQYYDRQEDARVQLAWGQTNDASLSKLSNVDASRFGYIPVPFIANGVESCKLIPPSVNREVVE